MCPLSLRRSRPVGTLTATATKAGRSSEQVIAIMAMAVVPLHGV